MKNVHYGWYLRKRDGNVINTGHMRLLNYSMAPGTDGLVIEDLIYTG